MDDLRSVVDAIGSQRAALLGTSEGSATYPERVFQLSAHFWNRSKVLRGIERWGKGRIMRAVVPSRAENLDTVSKFAKFERLSASPGAYKAAVMLNWLIDVRAIVPTVRVPTLDRRLVPVEW